MINKLVNSSNVVYNVEKVKLNKAPRHFFDEDITKKSMTINGKKVDVRMRAERTQYVLFQITEVNGDKEYVQSYYVRNHNFFNETNVKSVVKAEKVETTEVKEEVKA